MRMLTHRNRSIATVWGVLLASTLALAITAQAPAQFARATGITEISVPEFLSRDLILIRDGLQLDEAQRIIVESLYDQYVREFQKGWTEAQEQITSLADRADQSSMNDREILNLVLSPLQTWRDQRERLGEDFLQNIQLILNEQQMQGWETFVQRMKREKLIRKAQFAGEGLDLFAVLRDMHVPREIMDRINPVLDSYGLEILSALERRERSFTDNSRDLLNMLIDQDARRAVGVVREQVQLRVAVREVNDRYIHDIAAVLPQPLSAEFIERSLRRGYPSVYEMTQADRMFEAALRMTELDRDTREAIVAIRDQYQTAIGVINENLYNEVRKTEPAAEIHRAELYAARVNNESIQRQPNTTYTLFRDRSTLVMDYINRLKDVMPIAMFAELPGSERYMKKEILSTQEELDEARRIEEKLIFEANRRALEEAKDKVRGAEMARRAREAQRQQQNNSGGVPE